MTTAVKLLLVSGLSLLISACSDKAANKSGYKAAGEADRQINSLLDTFNAAAARADYATYFNCLDEDAVFIGTDATERWSKDSFAIWAKPFFDRGKAWNFKSVERHLYFANDSATAWFDELLDTQMKICRGSGVIVKKKDQWKIKQYVLSATIPNGILDTVVSMKAAVEDLIIKEKSK